MQSSTHILRNYLATMMILFLGIFVKSKIQACAPQQTCPKSGPEQVFVPSNVSQKIDFQDLLQKHGEYFKTEAQLEIYKQQVKSSQPKYFDTIYHCCCESQVQLRNLTMLRLVNPPANGSPWVSVVQVPGWSQYFEVWTCESVVNCAASCVCDTISYITSAVVYTTSYPGWAIKHVYVDGFCSCLNN